MTKTAAERQEWFKKFGEKAGLTSRNINFIINDICRHAVFKEDRQKDIDNVEDIFFRISHARTSVQMYREMERLLEYTGQPTVIRLGLLARASKELSGIKDLRQIDGTDEMVQAVTENESGANDE